MKKQFFSGILALVLVAFVSYGISKNQSVDQISDLALQNVEALASIEGPGGGGSTTTWSCSGFWGTCSASCGKCGTSVSGNGNPIGMHRCN